jgi:hypothetical protein
MTKIVNGKHIYGVWAGDPVGQEEDPTRCVMEVSTRERWAQYHQCFRKRGYGLKKLYCKQHAKINPEVKE